MVPTTTRDQKSPLADMGMVLATARLLKELVKGDINTWPGPPIRDCLPSLGSEVKYIYSVKLMQVDLNLPS